MSKTRLINRLKMYYPIEKFHAFITFPITFLYFAFNHPPKDIIFLLYGIFVCILILFQGQKYWKLKLYRLTHKKFDQKKNLSFFRKSKKLNFILLSCIPLVLIFQLFLSDWEFLPENQMGFAIAFNVFAILEHINYYHTQLMIDNEYDFEYVKRNKRLKIASLAKDLKENQI